MGKQRLRVRVRDIFNKMEVHVCVEMGRTGRPPILDTAASLRSDADSTGPSGTPRWIDVSIWASSSSSSDQYCVDEAILRVRARIYKHDGGDQHVNGRTKIK